MALSTWMPSGGDLLQQEPPQDKPLQRQPVQVQQGTVQVDGAAMAYLRAGEGPELLLLHGLLGTAGCWEAALPELAAESTVYAVDALGIGDSERVPGLNCCLETSADRVVAFLDAVGVEKTDLVGTSHGGAVALMVAAKYPGRVRSLALHAPANPFCGHAASMVRFYSTAAGQWCARRVPAMPASLKAFALGRMYGDPRRIRAGSLARYDASLQIPGTIDYILAVLKHWTDDMVKLRRALKQVRSVPSLLVWGDRDRAVSLRSAEALQHYFEDATLVVMPGVGHLPFEEAPEAFSSAVNGFLRQGGSRREGTSHTLHLVSRRTVA